GSGPVGLRPRAAGERGGVRGLRSIESIAPPSPPPSPRWEEGVPPCHDESPCSPNFSYAAWRLLPVFCNADHTVCAVAGMVKFSEPIALVMALITAGGAAGAPAPPPPLMPSGFSRPFGVAVWEVCPRRVSARR